MEFTVEEKFEHLNISFESDEFCCIDFTAEKNDEVLLETNVGNITRENENFFGHASINDNKHRSSFCEKE